MRSQESNLKDLRQGSVSPGQISAVAAAGFQGGRAGIVDALPLSDNSGLVSLPKNGLS